MVVAASAQSYEFDYTTASGDWGNLVLTTSSSGMPRGEALITAVSGVIDGHAVTGFAGGSGQFKSGDGVYSLDNLVYLPGKSTNPFAPNTVDSLGFMVTTSAGEFNLRSGPGFAGQGPLLQAMTPTGVANQSVDRFSSFRFGAPPSGTPEPFTLGLGIAALALGIRRKKLL